MLASARLGDDAPLPHAPSEKHLTHGVVDLVRAGVVQIFAFEPHACADVLRQAWRIAQRRRPPDVRREHVLDVRLERGIGTRCVVLSLQLVESRD